MLHHISLNTYIQLRNFRYINKAIKKTLLKISENHHDQVPCGTLFLSRPVQKAPDWLFSLPASCTLKSKVSSMFCVQLCIVGPAPSSRNPALHHCSFQTTIPLKMAKAFQFPGNDAVYKVSFLSWSGPTICQHFSIIRK